jgi:hypothetical protein
MRPLAHLINTARGDVVDSKALIKAFSVLPRRSLNMLMKLPKPLYAEALRLFFRQQIFLSKENP